MPNGVGALFYEQLESSNSKAIELAAHEDGPLWIACGKQSAGRGRQGRAWTSKTGNLFTSLLWKPTIKATDLSPLPFVVALAVRQTLVDLGLASDSVKCKWPNDIIVKDKKLCGILIESSITAEENINYLIIGIGINLQHHPEDAQFPACNLQDLLGMAITPIEALTKLSNNMENYKKLWFMDGFNTIRSEWTNNAWGLGQERMVRTSSESFVGTLHELMDDGALRIGLNDGTDRLIYAGDVFPNRQE